MKRSLVIALALATAVPVISIPVASDAQVLAGRNAARRPAPRPRLTEAEENRLFEAEELVFQIDEQIGALQAAGETQGGLTEAQQAEINTLTRRREDAQRTIDRLEAKRNR
jgi:UDP:flavonoid glycosyltransferase YjiC (YdhE family)